MGFSNKHVDTTLLAIRNGTWLTFWHLFIPLVILFGAWTADRLVHLIWAGAFFLLILVLAIGVRAAFGDSAVLVKYWVMTTHPGNHSHVHGVLLAVFVLFLGSWLPDIDWKFGAHRSPVTHSAIPFCIVYLISRKLQFGDVEWGRLLVPVFGVSLGSHLIIDFFQGGNLVGVPMHWEFAYYSVNGVVVCGISYLMMRKRLQCA